MGDKYLATASPEQRRLKDTELVVPICFGTVAWWLGKKADEYHSHRWTVYARGPNNEDLSHIISKVSFQLHPSFAVPVRHLEKAPYEVTEIGWGEFEIGITIHFNPLSGEKPVELVHGLKLYAENEAQTTKKPVVKESYEEIVFSEPSEAFYKQAVAVQPGPGAASEHAAHFLTHSDRSELAVLQHARNKISAQMAQAKQQVAALGAM
mmetsp:Transcript_2947/g.10002  ORF Transcript_2947/g.10002 Transcript_2947/m.10002 type:complete len:208 (+) Transcript_2947:76-699(+)